MVYVYLDNEFDAVRMDGRFRQQVIAIGAWLCDSEFRRAASFYSCVRPAGFRQLSYHVRRLTRLRDADIRQAPPFPQVIDRFLAWLLQYAPLPQVTIYSFGPDDSRTLCANAAFYHHPSEALFARIEDLQRLLSARVRWQRQIVSKTLSLETLKAIYRIQGEVEHNALNDALDLYHIHAAYRADTPLDEEAIRTLYETLCRKQQEGERKRRRQQVQRLIERFADCRSCILIPQSLEKGEWAKLCTCLFALAPKAGLTLSKRQRHQLRIPPQKAAGYLQQQSEQLYCWLCFAYAAERVCLRLTLRYHNANEAHTFLKQWFSASPDASSDEKTGITV